MLNSLLLWLQQAHFIRPWWLLALIPVMLLIGSLWLRRRSAGQWQEFIAPHLLHYLLDGSNKRRRLAPLLGLGLLWTLAVIALAGPAWEKLPQPVQKSGSALVILWDMSPSMMAQDLKPSRLMRSRLKLTDLLRARREGITGLVVYAGESHVVTPLTDDSQTIISLLPALSPTAMPLPGSNPEMALRTAHQLLANAGIPKGNVLMITDDIVPEAFDTLARIQSESQHQLTLWGVGTREGAPIPLPRGGFAQKPDGTLVNARLDEDRLQDFAADIGAYYVPLLADNEDIDTLQTLFQAPGENLRETDREFDAWYEHGPWLLVLMLPFVAQLYRRGWLMCLPLFALPLMSPNAQAGFWDDLWQTPDQQGQKALADQQPEIAAQLFKDPAWRGTALYRAGDYSAALEAFKHNQSSDSLYNQGNSLMQLGKVEAAIDAYKQALEQNPDNADAAANLELAQRLLEQQQQQSDNGDDGQQQESSQQSAGDQQQNTQGDSQQQQNADESQSADGQQPYDDPDNNQSQTEQNAQQNPGEQEDSDSAQDSEEQVTEQSETDEREANTRQQHAETEDSAAEQTKDAATASLAPAEQREQQEALEQWLRKVPDDPSGLLRNKFQHQHRERRQSGHWQQPDNGARHRW